MEQRWLTHPSRGGAAEVRVVPPNALRTPPHPVVVAEQLVHVVREVIAHDHQHLVVREVNVHDHQVLIAVIAHDQQHLVVKEVNVHDHQVLIRSEEHNV